MELTFFLKAYSQLVAVYGTPFECLSSATLRQSLRQAPRWKAAIDSRWCAIRAKLGWIVYELARVTRVIGSLIASKQSPYWQLLACGFASLEPALVWTDDQKTILIGDLAVVPVTQANTPQTLEKYTGSR